MDSQNLITQQRQKEGKALKVFLIGSLLSSLAFHASAMSLSVGNIWSYIPQLEEPKEIEVTVTETPPEKPLAEELPKETPPEKAIAREPVTEVPPPEPKISQEVAFTPKTVAPPPLAPQSQAPLKPGQDAPAKESSSGSSDPVAPLTNSSGDIPIAAGSGAGPITSPEGQGNGFGNADQPTGFVPTGKPEGQPDGKPEGTSEGKPQGQPEGVPSSTPETPPVQTATNTVPSTPPVAPSPAARQPVCVSCPQPKYRGTEASPRVDLNVRPDGTVEVRLRQSSGNPDLDRETLETMSRWRFDPQTVPQGGVRKRVRVTYEEQGSNFQRQNAERRRQESEQQRQQRQAEERRSAPATTAASETPERTTTTAPKPASVPSSETPPKPAAPSSERPTTTTTTPPTSAASPSSSRATAKVN